MKVHICKIKDCNKPVGTYKRWNKSKTKQWTCWRTHCEKHHHIAYGMELGPSKRRGLLKEKLGKRCQICGWDKVSCDLHRIKRGCKGGKYVPGNMMLLCPNCHRIEHTLELQSGF